MTGVKPLPTKDEIKLFVEYIAEHFYRLSLMEIDNAFNLATAGKLDIEAEHYQSFSVIYISKIINSYKRFNGKYILDYRSKLEAAEALQNEPTKDEKMTIMIESILENFENFKKEPTYNHFGYISYDFLKNLGVIKLESEIKDILLEQARKMAIEELNEKKQEPNSSSDDIKNQIQDILNDASGKQELVIRICKNLGLIHYFEFILKNNLSLESEITKHIGNE